MMAWLLRTAAILTAVPFSVVIILMRISPAKAFHPDQATPDARTTQASDQMTTHFTEQVQDSMHGSVQERYQDRALDEQLQLQEPGENAHT